MKKINVFILMIAIAATSVFSSCDKNKGEDPDNNAISEQIEALSMNEKWINYLVAASSELRDDCVQLWAAWNGPEGISGRDLEVLGNDFFTVNQAEIGNGFAEIIKTAGEGNKLYKTQTDAIHTIINDGCANIANEVGEQKIGGPYGLAKGGEKDKAVLEVESWYSWNSITDYSDNIVSIRNSYFGGIGLTTASPNSISAFVKSIDPAFDQEVTQAIDRTYKAIREDMQQPFRNNLTGQAVVDAMDACTDLRDIFITNQKCVLKMLEGTDYDFTAALNAYADNVVVPTYKDMKDKAWALYEAAVALQNDPTNQNKLNAVCSAWKANRIPWEQSEAFLFGPADALGLDPSLDSWPLDQDDILGILKAGKFQTVEEIKGAINGETVRGFHTIELLLFKDGQNRTVRQGEK